MQQTIDAGHAKLINQILCANSQDQIQTFIYTRIKELKEHKVEKYVIRRVVDETAEVLNDFNLTDLNSQQSSNIKISKILLDRLKATI